MSNNMSDIEKMFAEAAGAAESTGEKDPSIYSMESIQQPKVDPKPTPQPKVEPKATQRVVEQPRAPLASKPQVRKGEGLTVESISKILEMRDLIDSYDDTEANFVKGYFNVNDEGSAVAHAIYNALVADKRDLDALDKIAKSKKLDAAERAFYLIGLKNDEVLAIYEQLELLIGSFTDNEITSVNDSNKLTVCRTLEKVIAELDSKLVEYIEKLQNFVSIASK